MKILVLSLLRLGDFLMQKPLLQDLRRRYPEAEIDVLVNPGTMAARGLFPEVSGWHVFDRDRLQKAVGTAEIPLMAPVRDVEKLISELSGKRYSMLLNFTHNRLSAHLAAAIGAGVKQGLVAEGAGFRRFENQWLRHFNDKFGGRDGGLFHYVEWLAGAFHLEAKPVPARPRGRRVLIQPLTSDAKKNWSLENWKTWLAELRRERPEFEYAVLGAPFEEEILRRHFDAEDLEIASLERVRELMLEARLLATGDTSIKHLAALEGVPVLEIALGSSDPGKVGVYQVSAAILKSSVGCAPCAAAGPCRRLSHECGEEISVARALDAARDLLADGATTERTRSIAAAGWLSGTDGAAGETIARSFEKMVWRLFLDEDGDVAASAAARWIDGIEASWPGFDWEELSAGLSREQEALERILHDARRGLQEAANLCIAGNFDPILLQSLRRQWGALRASRPRMRLHLQELNEAADLPFAHPLAFFGHARRVLEDLAVRLTLRNRILQTINEHGGVHERLPGNLPERGPEAT